MDTNAHWQWLPVKDAAYASGITWRSDRHDFSLTSTYK